jgi:hypothetical protein
VFDHKLKPELEGVDLFWNGERAAALKALSLVGRSHTLGYFDVPTSDKLLSVPDWRRLLVT